MALINKASLRQYLKLNYNVLFIGLHGVGKTTIVKEVFTEMYGDRWRYFSASTLDPWVDFVGVPKVIGEGDDAVLDLIRPKFIKNDEVEAIFFDEFNRAPDKVINAVMELLQFKSINDHKLNNLKVIWAAINPEDDDDTYSVNHLDPAQIDRFQVQLEIPYKIDAEYFDKKYPRTGSIFRSWWNDLPGDMQRKISPRRMDYLAEAHEKGCRLEDFLGPDTKIASNVKKLRDALKSVSFHDEIKQIKDVAAATTFIKDINNATKLLDLIKLDPSDQVLLDFLTTYKSLLPQELLQPFFDFMYAKQEGADGVRSLEELANLLPNDSGNQKHAAMINGVDFNVIHKAGGSFESDVRNLYLSNRPLASKLASRCCDIMINCQGKTLQRVFWDVDNKPTNFQKIAVAISKVGGMYTERQRQTINKRLVREGVVKDNNFL